MENKIRGVHMFDNKTALIIVDVQNGFLNENSQKVVEVVEKIQPFYHHVAATRFYNAEGSPFRKLLDWHAVEKGSYDFQIGFKLCPDADIFNKSGYSSYNVELQEWLSSKKIEKIHLCGINTEVCVLLTASDLFMAGYETSIIEEANASTRGAEFHKAGLTSLKHILGNHSIKQWQTLLQLEERKDYDKTAFDRRSPA